MRHPYSVEAFRDWLKTKPANEEFRFYDTKGCLGYQYIKSLGLPIESYGVVSWTELKKDGSKISHLVPAEFGVIVDVYPSTFGAALERAERLLRGELQYELARIRQVFPEVADND